MATSIDQCARKTERTCKFPCQLEYSADGRGGRPVCVPHVDSLRGKKLTMGEISTVKKILVKILPSLDSHYLDHYLGRIRPDMEAYINTKIAAEVSLNRYASWRDLVTRVAATAVAEMCSTCPLCWNDLNNPVGDTVHTTPCCGNIIHRHCYDQWAQSNAECMICRTGVNMHGVVGGVIHEVEQHFANEGIDFGGDPNPNAGIDFGEGRNRNAGVNIAHRLNVMITRFKMFIQTLITTCLCVLLFVIFLDASWSGVIYGKAESYVLHRVTQDWRVRGVSSNPEWFNYNVYNETFTPLSNSTEGMDMLMQLLDQNMMYTQLWEQQYLSGDNTNITALRATLFDYERDFHDLGDDWGYSGDKLQKSMDDDRRLRFARKYIKDRKEMRRLKTSSH